MAADERTPLLPAVGHAGGVDGSGSVNANAATNGTEDDVAVAQHKQAAARIFAPPNRILFAGFLMSFTLGITQVPIVYVFRLMECQIFYESHPGDLPPNLSPGAQCQRREIDAGTAMQYSLLGMTTSFSGVLNLFVCGYFIKKIGPRWAFVSQTCLLGTRVTTQIIGVTFGGRLGEIIFQVGQLIGIIGGPRGYILVLNTTVGEIVPARERTAVFGRLQGSTMLGTAFGYLLGGALGDITIRRPFEVAFFLFIVSAIYGVLFFPNPMTTMENDGKQAGRAPGGFFAPLKVIVPHKYRLASGQVIKNYGLVFLALGIFLGVFASGYAPALLQLYGTSKFHFTTTENGWLMFGNSLIRGLFLLFLFPKIIASGRIWFNGRTQQQQHQQAQSSTLEAQEQVNSSHTAEIPTSPAEFPILESGNEVPQEPMQTSTHRLTEGEGKDDSGNEEGEEEGEGEEEDSGTGFDLLFVRWSLVVDSIVTLITGFSSHGWQVYISGFLLPFASGSAPAAKGVMTELCPSYQRPDAISAITLVESSSMLVTQGLFGLIFAAFAEMERPSLTFFCNAGIAIIASNVLFLARLPPANSRRVDDDQNEDESEGEGEGEGEGSSSSR